MPASKKPKPKRGVPGEPVTVAVASSGVTVALSAAAPVAEIVVGLRLAADGEHVLVSLSSRAARAGAAAAGAADIGSLTRREREVLRLLSEGWTNPEIARELCITVGTTRVHVKRIYRKLDVSFRWELLGIEQ
jgi:DNA-binding NarL/FixJ family response regulator